MGQLELFARRTVAEETERMTSGPAGWQDPPEVTQLVDKPNLGAHVRMPRSVFQTKRGT